MFLPNHHPAAQGLNPPARLMRLPDVEAATGLKKTTIYTAMARKQFPAPRRIGVRAVAWNAADIEAWIAARPSVEAGQ